MLALVPAFSIVDSKRSISSKCSRGKWSPSDSEETILSCSIGLSACASGERDCIELFGIRELTDLLTFLRVDRLDIANDLFWSKSRNNLPLYELADGKKGKWKLPCRWIPFPGSRTLWNPTVKIVRATAWRFFRPRRQKVTWQKPRDLIGLADAISALASATDEAHVRHVNLRLAPQKPVRPAQRQTGPRLVFIGDFNTDMIDYMGSIMVRMVRRLPVIWQRNTCI